MLYGHVLLIAHISGVWLLELEVFINVLNGPEAEPEGKSQATPKTAPACASRTTILNLVLTGHWILSVETNRRHMRLVD